jgi:tRNA1(Val) A37 N6-methylase TrmN6
MTETAGATTVDAFLGGAVEAVQPAAGHHRAGLDAVLLAAALPATASGAVVDLGAGAGVAGFCVAARAAAVTVTLAERHPELVACARAALRRPANAAFAARVAVAEIDIAAPEAERAAAGLARASAAALIMNPPFHDPATVRSSPAAGRAGAHVREAAGLDLWFRVAAHVLAPGGTLIAIDRAAALPQMLAAAAGRFGGLALLPVHPRPGAAATRLLLRGIKGRRGAPTLLPGLVLHGDTGNAYAPALQAILRDGAGLAEVHPSWDSVR